MWLIFLLHFILLWRLLFLFVLGLFMGCYFVLWCYPLFLVLFSMVLLYFVDHLVSFLLAFFVVLVFCFLVLFVRGYVVYHDG